MLRMLGPEPYTNLTDSVVFLPHGHIVCMVGWIVESSGGVKTLTHLYRQLPPSC